MYDNHRYLCDKKFMSGYRAIIGGMTYTSYIGGVASVTAYFRDDQTPGDKLKCLNLRGR